MQGFYVRFFMSDLRQATLAPKVRALMQELGLAQSELAPVNY